MDLESHIQIVEVLDAVRDLTIATIRSDGLPQAAAVELMHDDPRLCFATALDSPYGKRGDDPKTPGCYH